MLLLNNIKTAWRNLRKNSMVFLVNLIGLVSGLSCTVLIYLWAQDEYSIDKCFALDRQLYQVMEVTHENGKVDVLEGTQGLLAETLSQTFPEVEKSSLFFSLVKEGFSINLTSESKQIVKAGGAFADRQFFEMFSYPIVTGQSATALDRPESMVISKQLAQTLFGTPENAIGKPVPWEVAGIKGEGLVSAVFDNNLNTSQKFDFLLTKAALFQAVPNFKEWHNEGANTFLQLRAGTDVDAFNAKIKDFLHVYRKDDRFNLQVRPYSSAYLYNHYENGSVQGGRIAYLRLFSVIGFLILLIACINFMNLSTARMAERRKEIGIKKAIGSSRWQLILQFLVESGLTVALSVLAAIGVVWMLIEPFNALTGKQIALQLNVVNLAGLGAIAGLAGLMAGIYPAFYLSAAKPMSMIRTPVANNGGRELVTRKSLVVFQFIASTVLILAVTVVYLQIEMIQHMDLGYNRESLVYLDRDGSIHEQTNLFLERAKALSGVKQATAVSGSFAQAVDNSTTVGLGWEGKTDDQKVKFSVKMVDDHFFETMEIRMAEGRSFSNSYGDEKHNVIFNETAIKAMGLKNPIGKTIQMWGQELSIVGVAKDFYANSVHELIPPTVIIYDPERTLNLVVRLERGKEKEGIAGLEQLAKSMNPNYPFRYTFLDEKFSQLYAGESRMGVLSRYFAMLAIVISCLGLFGLATFTAEQRRKEIGVRKVLGASVAGITGLLVGDFLKLVFLALLIATPISFYFMKEWLSDFAYHIDLKWWMFAGAGITALGIALFTVSFQSIKAALANPVDSLRSD